MEDCAFYPAAALTNNLGTTPIFNIDGMSTVTLVTPNCASTAVTPHLSVDGTIFEAISTGAVTIADNKAYVISSALRGFKFLKLLMGSAETVTFGVGIST